MKKNWANYITVFRILLSLTLPFVPVLGLEFFVIYFVCCLCDVFDGIVARGFGISSATGSKLDSFGDALFIVIVVLLLIPVIHLPVYLWIWAIGILFIRVGTGVYTLLRYHELIFLHTYANKITGLILFTAPALYLFINVGVFGSVMCLIATFAAVEELIIHFTTEELDMEMKSLVSLIQSKRK